MARLHRPAGEPPFGPPHPGFTPAGPLLAPPVNDPDIKLEQGEREMPEFHAILTTDYVDYDTTTNRLGLEGAAVERGDVALGLAVADPADPPRWAVVRNTSDRSSTGTCPPTRFTSTRRDHLGGRLLHRLRPSTIGALATWGIAIPLLRAVSGQRSLVGQELVVTKGVSRAG
jgi:hypothetical protein